MKKDVFITTLVTVSILSAEVWSGILGQHNFICTCIRQYVQNTYRIFPPFDILCAIRRMDTKLSS